MRKSSNSFVFPIQVSQIFLGDSLEEEGWSVVLHVNSRSTRVSQELLGNYSLDSVFDMEGNSLEHDFLEEDMDTDVALEYAETNCDIIIKQSFACTRICKKRSTTAPRRRFK